MGLRIITTLGHSAVDELLDGGGKDQLVSLLQEGLAAPEALLIHQLKVRVIAIIGIFNNELFLWIIAPK